MPVCYDMALILVHILLPQYSNFSSHSPKTHTYKEASGNAVPKSVLNATRGSG